MKRAFCDYCGKLDEKAGKIIWRFFDFGEWVETQVYVASWPSADICPGCAKKLQAALIPPKEK